MIKIPLTKGKVAIVDDCDAHLKNWNWHISKNGYAIKLFTKSPKVYSYMYMHHAIMGQPIGELEIDHINGNPSDNRRSNLRMVTHRINLSNTKWQRGEKKKSSKYIGVRFCRTEWGGKIYEYWRAAIRIGKKRIHLGCFKNEIEAHKAYQKALSSLCILILMVFTSNASILDEKFKEYRKAKETVLSPFPLYFTPLGKTKYEIVEIDNEKWIIGWDEKGNFATWIKLKDYIKMHRPTDWVFRISLGIGILIWLYLFWKLLN